MNIVFAQYSPETQDFFKKEYGQAHSLTIDKFPHYRFIKNSEDAYERYIKASWKTNNQAVVNKQLDFEGHERSNAKQYEYIFKHFKAELIGYTADGVHSNAKSRPLFRCVR